MGTEASLDDETVLTLELLMFANVCDGCGIPSLCVRIMCTTVFSINTRQHMLSVVWVSKEHARRKPFTPKGKAKPIRPGLYPLLLFIPATRSSNLNTKRSCDKTKGTFENMSFLTLVPSLYCLLCVTGRCQLVSLSFQSASSSQSLHI